MSFQPTPQPYTAKVIQALADAKGSPKTRGVLSKIQSGQRCFCIEGVFCSIATSLGYPGAFESQTAEGSEVLFVPEYPGNGFVASAPDAIFAYLGIPRRVPWACMPAGFKYNRIRPLAWHSLNDSSDLTLDELIDVAIASLCLCGAPA